MSLALIENQKFENLAYQENVFAQGEYENCTFTNCDLSNVDLSGCIFIECEFDSTNLSSAKVDHTSFRDVIFLGCKILGVHFEACNPFLFSPAFKDCQLNLSSFFQLQMKETQFDNCSLQEVDFVETDLTESSFVNCDLTGSIFEKTILDRVDFSTSSNFAINPTQNSIKKARFSRNNIEGLLYTFDIVLE